MQTIKNLAGRLLARLGYQVFRRSEVRPFARGLRDALASPTVQGLELGTVIDVGASDGRWTREAWPFFPRSRFHLIEANPVHAGALRSLCTSDPRVSFTLKAASDRDGQIPFDDSDPFGGAASAEGGGGLKHLPATTIDSVVEADGLNGPFLIKLDTHGFEVPILLGASRTLESTRALIVEVYNFEVQPGALRFHEMVAFLEKRGFRVLDLFDTAHRPGDGALWQMDMIFLADDHPCFSKTDFAL
jgi:FkbM family methyltransferase